MVSNPDRYREINLSTKQVGRMRSGDFGKEVNRITNFDVGRTRDTGETIPEFSSRLKKEGLHSPVEIGFTYRGAALLNGHHRYLAANQAGIKKMKGIVHKDDYQDVVHFKAKYTPPGQDYTWRGFGDKNKGR
jgi:hypothetical protein